MNDTELYELEQLANEAKLRGTGFFRLAVEDWRDIPTSQLEIDRMAQNEQEYWQSVASQLVSR